MANILKIKNELGEWIDIPAIKGDTGPQGPVGPQGPKGDPGEVTTQQMTDYVAQELVSKQDKLTSGNNITISEDNVISATVPENVVTTDTEQEITGKKTLKSINQNYWAEIGVIDNKNVSGISFKDNNSKVNVYRDDTGVMKIETPSYRTRVQIKNVLIEGKEDGSNTIRSMSNSNKLYLGEAAIPISTLYAANLSDGTTTKTMTDVLSGSNTSYQTTEPTSAINDGGIHIVLLGSEPTARYSGYIYLVAEEQ